LASAFQTTFRKLDGGDNYVSSNFQKLFTKALLPCLKILSTSPSKSVQPRSATLGLTFVGRMSIAF
jgi:hypothetical protein